MISVVEARSDEHVSAAKQIADRFRRELGFHTAQAFQDSGNRGELLVALMGSDPVGFVRFHHRRDRRTTLYEIASVLQGAGVGRGLISVLIAHCRAAASEEIQLKCPIELPANLFYSKVGFILRQSRSVAGIRRSLFEWHLPISGLRPLSFVASITASTNDLTHMVGLWEREGPTSRPFERCILTPLFTDPGALSWVRYMHDRWGIRVVFDSGGFFVQQGKIRYDQLFFDLMRFYEANDWAETYVLPDFVPTSRSTPAEVEERVQITIGEGIKFYKRLPTVLRPRALGVLQGHRPRHLRECFEAFLDGGLAHLGFGSFDTAGRNSEINLLTDSARRRLGFVRDLMRQASGTPGPRGSPSLHLFGVSSPRSISDFAALRATSYDSSGWLRTAGFGNVYLPFTSRRNISHGGSAISLGTGQSAATYYALAERSEHSCPFCTDFRRLQADRFARMWHNAIVFREMTERVNGGQDAAAAAIDPNRVEVRH